VQSYVVKDKNKSILHIFFMRDHLTYLNFLNFIVSAYKNEYYIANVVNLKWSNFKIT